MGSYFGIDVSKDHLDVARADEPGFFRVENNEEGIKSVVETMKAANEPFAVVEATGGYEVAVAHALVRAGVDVARVNPRRPRAFAVAIGVLAKTDKIDGHILARFGEATKPPKMAMVDEPNKELDELVRRRRDLVDARSAEKNRLKQASGRVRPNIKRHIDFLDEEVKQLDKQIEDIIAIHQKLAEQAALLRSVKGVGLIVAATLLALLPELGAVSRGEIAALAGLAPYNNDSGKSGRPRHIRGGRQEVRAMMHMAVKTATRHNPRLKMFYERLIASGKGKKLAHVAASRKLLTWLNAMMRSEAGWDDSLVVAP